jgi:hypothetical protein
MRKLLIIVIAIFAFSSCGNTWDKESKDTYLQTCAQDATVNGLTPEQAKQMCDCRLEKIMKKYPSVNDFMENADKVISDPDVLKCGEDVKKKN